MAEVKKLAATVRSGTGKGAARSVRREHAFPASSMVEARRRSRSRSTPKRVAQLIFAGHFLTTIFEIDVEGQGSAPSRATTSLTSVKDLPLHVDFLRLKAGSRVRVEVPVHFINHEAAPGIKRGGALNIVYHSVEMWVPADNIPEAITGDLDGLDFNDSLHISAFTLPEGCKPTNPDKNFTVATVTPPLVSAEEPAPVAAAAAPAAAAPAAKAPAKEEKKK